MVNVISLRPMLHEGEAAAESVPEPLDTSGWIPEELKGSGCSGCRMMGQACQYHQGVADTIAWMQGVLVRAREADARDGGLR